MTIQHTTWSPDTCKCEIEYEWDDTVSQELRTHNVSKVIKACAIHAAQPSKESHYVEVLDENQSKNKAIGLLVKTIAKLDGGENEVKWRFDENRDVILSHPLLTQKDKDDMNALDKSDIKKQVRIE